MVLEQQVSERARSELVEHLARNLADPPQRCDAPLNRGDTAVDDVIVAVDVDLYALIVLESSQGAGLVIGVRAPVL
jgi:hypothetical protein